MYCIVMFIIPLFGFYRHGLANSTVHFSLSCNGSESHILNCEQAPIVNSTCTHEFDIEIICCKLSHCTPKAIFVARFTKWP